MKSDRVWLVDILHSAERIREYITGMSEAQFAADERTIDATAYELMALGEAAKNLTQRTQKSLPTVPWADLRLVRNTVAHEHNALNPRTLWNTLVYEIPSIEAAVRLALQDNR